MNIAASLFNLVLGGPIASLLSLSLAQEKLPVRERSSIHSENLSFHRVQVEKRVLRRDARRCRVCDRRGDQVPLSIRPIERDAYRLDALVTICKECECVANDWNIQATNIPEFLRHLWQHLHHKNQYGLILPDQIPTNPTSHKIIEDVDRHKYRGGSAAV